MHLDDEQVQRLLHGELEPVGDRTVRQHLSECETCRTLVDDAGDEELRIFGLLRELDHPLPEVDPSAVLPAVPSPLRRWERWAAGILLMAAAAGAAYAAPGSPLPAVIERLLGGDGTVPTQDRPAPSQDRPAGADAAPTGGGIAVTPGDRITIRFLVGDPAVADLSLGEGDQVVVRTVQGLARFTSDVDHLSVRSQGPARFEISVPRSAPLVEILAGDVPVFRKQGSGIVSEARPGENDRYTLILFPPTP
jgi:hypothetical protein